MPQKAHLNGSKAVPKKDIFRPQKCHFPDFPILTSVGLGKSKWGLSKWGLKVFVHNWPRLSTIVVILCRKFPLERGPKRAQL